MQFSVHSTDGPWGPWLDAAAEEEDQPDAGSPRGGGDARLARRQPHLGRRRERDPVPHHAAAVRDLRASFVRSPELRIPLRAVASAGSPPIVSRSAWGADESIREAAPQYAPAIRFASVHHTAGPNDYSPAQAAAIMRGIEVYHVKSNGWNDIGYNFLVDRYGTVYEGRYGGIDRNVIGALRPRLQHRLDRRRRDRHVQHRRASRPRPRRRSRSSSPGGSTSPTSIPLSTLTFVSGGSERYRAGVPVFLRAVSGHRDTGLTTCPGDLLYAQLDAIAAKTQAIGLAEALRARR